MHVYIYDDYLNNGRYNKIINRLEIRLTDLGLNGKIIRLGGIKNIKRTIQDEIKLGARTFIAVGNNQTVNRIIGTIVNTEIYNDFQQNTLLGIIPIGSDNSIADSFGIKNWEEACNILLARRIKKIDLGFVGSHYFLNQASIESLGTVLEIDDYYLEILDRGVINIINLLNASLSNKKDPIIPSPYDGLLNVFIKIKNQEQSYLSAKKIKVTNPTHKLIIDNSVEVATPLEITVVKNKINVIVGKERMFE